MRCNSCVGCVCGNHARYVDADCKWTCSLCAMGKPALRAVDAPAVVKAVNDLLDALDAAGLAVGLALRQDLRGLLGRWHSAP